MIIEKAIRRLENNINYLVEVDANPKAIEQAQQTYNGVISGVNELKTSIKILEEKLHQAELNYTNLHHDTKALVNYCQLRGVNPNDIFIFMKGWDKTDFLRKITELAEITKNKTMDDWHVSLALGFGRFFGFEEIKKALNTNKNER